jgi:transposase
MAEQFVPDEVWSVIQPLLPPKPPHLKGGRPWIEDRAVLGGITYVLRAGVPWRLLPAKELGSGSSVTCRRMLHQRGITPDAACEWRCAELRRSQRQARVTAPTAHRNQTASRTARTPW